MADAHPQGKNYWNALDRRLIGPKTAPDGVNRKSSSPILGFEPLYIVSSHHPYTT